MKILIADKFQKAYLGDLQSLGHEITLNPDLGENDLQNEIKGYEVLIVRSTKVNAATIEASDCLQLIIRAGAGVNTIDVDAAAKKAIFVTNIPGKNSIAVAELAFGLILSIDRNIPDNVADLRKGEWNKKKYSKANGICGRTLGIIGIGSIGQALADRAKAFGMKVIAFDEYASKDLTNPKIANRLENRVFSFVHSLEELAKASDVISFHVPATAQTKKMINKDFLTNVKNGAILINTSRGDIMDDEALLEAMNTKNIRLGVDVYNKEPAEAVGKFDSVISKHPNVYGTHHIGASTEQAQDAIAQEVIELLKNFEKGIVMYPVNILTKPTTKHTLILRLYDKVGVLAAVCDLLKEQGINVQQLEGKVFTGENTQHIVLNLDKSPDASTLKAIKNVANIIQADLKTSLI